LGERGGEGKCEKEMKWLDNSGDRRDRKNINAKKNTRRSDMGNTKHIKRTVKRLGFRV